MHVLGLLEMVIQVYFAVHAIKSGRNGWIFIILFFPVVGSLIYFFVEYLPEMQTSARARVSAKMGSPKMIKELQRVLEMTDSVKNRINLAEAYFHAGQYRHSIELLEKSLAGHNAKDPQILEGLCYSHFHNGDFPKVKEYLASLAEIQNGKLSDELRLLRAKTLEEMGEIHEALEAYKAIVHVYTGEEARCRYALLLKKVGEKNKAKEIFKEILKNAKLYPRQYKKFHKQWVDIARLEVE